MSYRYVRTGKRSTATSMGKRFAKLLAEGLRIDRQAVKRGKKRVRVKV